MANSTYAVTQIKFDINPDFTEVTVVCGPPSCGMLGVQGAHKKAFSKERTCVDIIENEIAKAEYLLW